VEEVVIESAMEVEIAPEPEPEIADEEIMEVQETVVAQEEVVAESVHTEVVAEVVEEPESLVFTFENEEKQEETDPAADDEKPKSSKEIEPEFEKLSIKTENAERDDKVCF